MPRRRKQRVVYVRQPQNGGNLLKSIKNLGKKIDRGLKKTKIISKLGDAGINFVPKQYQIPARLGLASAKQLGYGKKGMRF